MIAPYKIMWGWMTEGQNVNLDGEPYNTIVREMQRDSLWTIRRCKDSISSFENLSTRSIENLRSAVLGVIEDKLSFFPKFDTGELRIRREKRIQEIYLR